MKDLITRLMGDETIRPFLLAKPAYGELPFLLDLTHFYLRGTLDRLICHEGEWMILDYKTDIIHHEEELKAKRESYQGQMDAYAVAASRILGISSLTTALLFTDGPFLVREKWDSSKLAQAHSALVKTHVELTEKTGRGEFAFPTDRSFCPACPYYALNYCGVKG